MSMSETDEYILDAIRKWVWAGFYSVVEMNEMIEDILEEDANETMLRAAIETTLSEKLAAEDAWPETTDCDRLADAFAMLDERRVLALHNTGYEMSDGHVEASEALIDDKDGHYFGYCFYHGQDVERAVDGGELCIAFDHIDGDVPEKLDVGNVVKEELERAGLTVAWNGTADIRLFLTNFDWKNRHQS